MLNARTDAYMIRHPDAFAETVRRAERYLAAGADCIFVPGVAAAEEIGRLTAAIGAPVNVVSGLGEMADHGTFGFAQGAIPYAELQQRFSR